MEGVRDSCFSSNLARSAAVTVTCSDHASTWRPAWARADQGPRWDSPLGHFKSKSEDEMWWHVSYSTKQRGTQYQYNINHLVIWFLLVLFDFTWWKTKTNFPRHCNSAPDRDGLCPCERPQPHQGFVCFSNAPPSSSRVRASRISWRW